MSVLAHRAWPLALLLGMLPVRAWAQCVNAGPIQYRGALSQLCTNGCSNSNLTLFRPVVTTPGDVLVAAIHVEPDNTFVDAGTGWTFLRAQSNPVGDFATWYWLRPAASNEPTSYAFHVAGTAAYVEGLVAAYSGFNDGGFTSQSTITLRGESHAAPPHTATVGRIVAIFSNQAATLGDIWQGTGTLCGREETRKLVLYDLAPNPGEIPTAVCSSAGWGTSFSLSLTPPGATSGGGADAGDGGTVLPDGGVTVLPDGGGTMLPDGAVVGPDGGPLPIFLTVGCDCSHAPAWLSTLILLFLATPVLLRRRRA